MDSHHRETLFSFVFLLLLFSFLSPLQKERGKKLRKRKTQEIMTCNFSRYSWVDFILSFVDIRIYFNLLIENFPDSTKGKIHITKQVENNSNAS